MSGGYDGVLKIHRSSDFFCEAAVSIHDGTISALAVEKVGRVSKGGREGGERGWK